MINLLFWLLVGVLLVTGIVQGIKEWQYERWVKAQVSDLDDEIEGLTGAE